MVQEFKLVKFADTITNPDLLSYLVDRLGLRTEVSEFIEFNVNNIPRNLNVLTIEDKLSDTEMYQETIQSPLPLVIVFSDLVSIKNFYNAHYSKIKENAALFAQGYSGGGNKMFRNFSKL